MISDSIESILDSIKERIRNPILGAYIISFISWNWEFIYSLFNFEKDCTRLEKIAFISNYIHNHSKWSMFICPLLFAFLSIVVFLIASNASSYLFDVSRNHIRTRIQKWSGYKESDFVSGDSFIKLSQINADLEKENKAYKTANGELIHRLNHLNASVEGSAKITNELTLEKEKLNTQIENLNQKITEAMNQNFMLPSINTGDFLSKPLHVVFNGTWRLDWSYITQKKSSGIEIFYIDNSNKHIVDNKVYFNTLNCLIDEMSGFLYFEKQRNDAPKDIFRNYLVKVNENEYRGYELTPDGGGKWSKVHYYKVDR